MYNKSKQSINLKDLLTIDHRLGQLVLGQIKGGQAFAYNACGDGHAVLAYCKGLAWCHDHLTQ